MEPTVYVVGTFDTKSNELAYLHDCLVRAIQRSAVEIITVDISTHPTEQNSAYVNISRDEVAGYHPYQFNFNDTRESATRAETIDAMARALNHFFAAQSNVLGVIGLGGQTTYSILSQGLKPLGIGIPKVLISSLFSGSFKEFMDSSDILHLNSPCEFKGLNTITRKIISNGAAALAGMINFGHQGDAHPMPSVCISNNGPTSACTASISNALNRDFDCLVFNTLGHSRIEMQNIIGDPKCRAIFDLAPADITDSLFGGIHNTENERFETLSRANKPYIGSVGSLDAVHFGHRASIPIELSDRLFYSYAPGVTLMRTNAEENEHMGVWLAQQLNQFNGPVRLFLPLQGLSSLSKREGVFHNPEIDRVLFTALKKHFLTTTDHRLIEMDCAFDDEQFAHALLENFLEITRI